MNVTIGWLYPELMSTYGDRGNIMVLQKRCQWRGIAVAIVPIDFKSKNKDIQSCNIIFGGGAQDRQQTIVIQDLLKKKDVLKELFDKDVPGLFVCGAPQLLGTYYMTGDGQKLEGLGIFDMESKHFGKSKPRAIGNLICQISDRMLKEMQKSKFKSQKFNSKVKSESDSHDTLGTVVGFENHGGRTYLGEGVKPFAHVLYGNGNNGEDGTEGAIYKNCIATYSHGPFLPKNPHIADWLITKALEVKYKKKIELKPLDDSLEWQAHEYVVNRFLRSS